MMVVDPRVTQFESLLVRRTMLRSMLGRLEQRFAEAASKGRVPDGLVVELLEAKAALRHVEARVGLATRVRDLV